MQIMVRNKRLSKVLSDEKKIKKKYGQLANKIQMRINILQAADNLDNIPTTPPYRLHELHGESEGLFAIDLNKNYRLIIGPIGVNKPYNKKEIKTINIIEIIDYH